MAEATSSGAKNCNETSTPSHRITRFQTRIYIRRLLSTPATLAFISITLTHRNAIGVRILLTVYEITIMVFQVQRPAVITVLRSKSHHIMYLKPLITLGIMTW